MAENLMSKITLPPGGRFEIPSSLFYYDRFGNGLWAGSVFVNTSSPTFKFYILGLSLTDETPWVWSSDTWDSLPNVSVPLGQFLYNEGSLLTNLDLVCLGTVSDIIKDLQWRLAYYYADHLYNPMGNGSSVQSSEDNSELARLKRRELELLEENRQLSKRLIALLGEGEAFQNETRN